jgi:hypothetical protein
MATVTISQTIDTLQQQQLNISAQTNVKAFTAPQNPQQPDIEYHPDRVKWQARTTRRLEADPSLLTSAVPEGFPKQLDSPLVWQSEDWKNETEWVYQLNGAEIKEISDAVKHFHSE